MKFNIPLKRTRFVGYALLCIQSVLLIVLALMALANRYEGQWQDYLNDQTSYNVYLNEIPSDKKDEVVSYLQEQAADKQFLLLKKEHINDTWALGVDGDPSKIAADFTFAGKQVVSKKELLKLIRSSNEQATLGLGQGSINQIAPIYKFPLSNQVVVYKLHQFNKINQTINGRYQLVGLSSEKEYKSIVHNLAKLTGLKQAVFEYPLSGSVEDNSFSTDLLVFGFLVANLGLFAFFFIDLLSSFKNFGVLVLLGWSKAKILWSRYKPFACFSLLAGLLVSCIFVITFGRNSFFTIYLVYLLAATLLSFLAFSIIFYLASFVVICANNIALIKANYPKKVVYTFIIAIYLLMSALAVGVSHYIDGPADAVIENARQALQWQKVEQMEVLKTMDTGADGIRAFSDPSSQLYKDMWNFYKEIANKKGTYLVSSFYASATWLTDRTLYKDMPTKPLTILTASPNYLQKINFSVGKVALKQALQGKRVFFVPDSYSAEKQRKFKIFLTDMLTSDISKSDVQTPFSKKQQVVLFTYHPRQTLFLWNNNPSEPTHSKTPIVDLVTPANMTYTDIGNLQVVGLGSNLKFASKKAEKQVMTNKLLTKYHLDDNKPEYTAVANYIDGEQKSLWDTITTFGIVLFLLLVILCLLIIVLAMTFKASNKQKIAVKTFLGFTFGQIYRLPLIIISLTTAIELVIVLIIRSRIGVPVVLLNYVIQMLVFYFYILRTQFAPIVNLLKGE